MAAEKLIRILIQISCILLVCASVVAGQSTGTGTISGTLSDKTGAVVPGVSLTVTHIATGFSRGEITSDYGYYALTALPIGQYDVKAELPGFKTFVQKNVVLETESRVTLNIMLEVGAPSESITVTETPPPIQSESGEISTLVSGVQISEQALNGRNFAQFLALGPGVVSGQTGHQMGVGQEGIPAISVHGGRINNNRFTFDGTLAMNTAASRAPGLYPPMEAIQEVRIMTSNYGADSGSNGYGQVNVVTKSGTRNFHGDIYEYFRNDALDARNFFASDVSPLKLNNFGYTLGGPVYFRDRYNPERRKTFFFWSESWSIRKGPQLTTLEDPPTSVFTATTPTAAMRRGDFSELLPRIVITDPQTGQPFPTNVIPERRIDSNAALLLDRFYPLPNRSGTPNFVFAPNSATRWREELVRIDHHVSERLSLMGRYGEDHWEQDQPVIKPGPQAFPTIGGFIRQPKRIFTGKLTTIHSRNAVNEFTLGLSMGNSIAFPSAEARRPAGLTIPEVFPSNRNNVIPTINLIGLGSIGAGDQAQGSNRSVTIKDDFSSRIRNHGLKFGFEILRAYRSGVNGTNLEGNFAFNGGATGYSMADFLLGEASSYAETQQREKTYFSGRNWEFYFQDDWKATPRFTLNLGVRYHIVAGAPQTTEKYNRISMFLPRLYDPSRAPRINPSSGEIVSGTGDPLNGFITADNRKGVDLPRSLARTHFDNFGPRLGFAWSPLADQKIALRGGYGIFYFWGNNNHPALATNPPFSQTINVTNTKLSNPAFGHGAEFPLNISSFDPDYWIPTVHQWSLSIQRQVARETVLSLAYVGTRATHLEQNVNINQPAPSVDVAQRRISANAIRPYKGYAFINFSERSASANYHGMEAHLVRRFHQGLLFEAAYTFSKAIEWKVGQDAIKAKNEKALSDLDRTHVVVLNYVYQLPFFKDQKGALGKLLGGWQLSGITNFQSGVPFTVTISGDRAGVGGIPRADPNGIPTAGTQRPNLTGTLERTNRIDQWFDTNAFTLSPIGTFGNAGRNILREPGINDWSVNLLKNTKVRWFHSEGANLQFGGEFFNAFNHPQFESVGSLFGNPNFGHVLSARDPRIIQLRMKISY